LSALLNTIVPIFGLMVLGLVAVRLRVLDEAGNRGLVLFVFNFAVPALLFRSLAQVQLPEDIEWGFLIAFYSGTLFIYALGMGVGRFSFRRSLDEQAIFGMTAAFSNTVLMGIPITLTAFGEEAALPLFLIIAFHSATLMPLTVALIQGSRGENVSAARQLRDVGVALARNPIVVGVFLGLMANLTQTTLPAGIDQLIAFLGDAAVPCALFAMGASLPGYPLMGDVSPAVALTVLKLAVHPLIVWVLASYVLGLEGLWVHVPVILAAMPSGVNTYLFGARYEVAPGVAARTVLLTSVLSLATISALILLFN
jgi:predicted permease